MTKWGIYKYCTFSRTVSKCIKNSYFMLLRLTAVAWMYWSHLQWCIHHCALTMKRPKIRLRTGQQEHKLMVLLICWLSTRTAVKFCTLSCCHWLVIEIIYRSLLAQLKHTAFGKTAPSMFTFNANVWCSHALSSECSEPNVCVSGHFLGRGGNWWSLVPW